MVEATIPQSDQSLSQGNVGAPLSFKVRGLVKRFDLHKVLDGLDFEAEPGSVIGLVGTNGAGKSTLIKCMMGLLKADAGVVEVGGHDAWDLPAQVKARIGYVDQQPRFYPWMKGSHLLAYIASFYPQWDDSLIEKLADEWDVPLNKAYGKLSPGQQQKIAVLAALGHGPELLILDEPVSAMDPVSRRAFLRTLLSFTSEANRTVILSTHITSDIERVASHVAVLTEGRINYFDELDELKDRVKRLRVHADAPLPLDFNVPGALRVEKHGDSATVLVVKEPAAVIAELESRGGLTVTADDLNLEEIFLELVQGARHA